MKMTRILIVTLVIAMMVSIVGCGNSAQTDNSGNVNNPGKVDNSNNDDKGLTVTTGHLNNDNESIATEDILPTEFNHIPDANESIEVTDDIVYTYDGDNESDAYTWAVLPNGARQFVKVSDIPDGEIDFIGGEVSVLIPEWPHMNYKFTITRQMYSEVSGLTQILYQNTATNDQSASAIIIICTVPGRYNIELKGWSAELAFPESGIYFLDGRANWEGRYVESLLLSAIVDSDEIEENPAEYDGNEIQVFTRGLCIGDSITEGVFDHDKGQVAIKKYSYPSVLNRITGVEIVNAGVAGLTSKTWYEASLDSSSRWGKWVNNEWVWHENPTVGATDTISTALDYSGYDFSIIHLGINDIGLMGDATLDEMISVYETNIYNIINKLKAENKGIKIFLCTIIPNYAVPGYTDYEVLNEKIREIANGTEDVFLIDLNTYSACMADTPYSYYHLTAIGYQKMAEEIKALISYTIKHDPESFKDVQFIGTEYAFGVQ